MMCHKTGRPPISTIGFGLEAVSSLMRVPRPPASITAFINSSLPMDANLVFQATRGATCTVWWRTHVRLLRWYQGHQDTNRELQSSERGRRHVMNASKRWRKLSARNLHRHFLVL